MKEKAVTSLKLGLSRKSSLKSKKQIDLLFKKGYAYKAYPLLVKYLPNAEANQDRNQLLFSVPKRSFKKAVARNQLKRRMREAYRLHQYLFSPKVRNGYLNIAFLYIGKEIVDFKVIEKSVISALQHLADHNEEKNKN